MSPMGSIRILLQPMFRGAQGLEIEEHGRVSLTSFGGGTSKVAAGETRAAEFVFYVAFLENVRGASPEFREFARLQGDVERRDATRVRCTLPSDWEFTNAPAPNPNEVSRYLLLGFDPASFENPGPATRRLFLPELPPGARHIEIGVSLEIAGAVEAERTTNDILDVPVARALFDPAPLRLVVGFPYGDVKLAHKPYRLTVGEKTYQGMIPESGEIVVSAPIGGETATLEVRPFQGSLRWYRWELNIGALAEVDSIEGVQGRLNSLGYPAGTIDGDAGPKTRQALRAFQHRHALLADGSVSAESKRKLQETYGC